MNERLQEIFAKHAAGQPLSQEELDFLNANPEGVALEAEKQGLTPEQQSEILNQATQQPSILGSEGNLNFNLATNALGNQNQQTSTTGVSTGTPTNLFAGLEAAQSTVPSVNQIPGQTVVAAEKTSIPSAKLNPDGTLAGKAPTIAAPNLKVTSATGETLDNKTLGTPINNTPTTGTDEDNLSKAALAANYLGAGIDLNSSLYLLGKGIGDKNTGLTVGAAGKTLLAGSRNFLSGLSTAKRNQFTEDYMEEQQRKGIVGNTVEVSQSRQDVGGGLFRDGGMTEKEKAFATELSQYMHGGKKKKNSIYQNGGESESTYTAGDIITFKDEKGKVVSGVIKEVKDGEIILED